MRFERLRAGLLLSLLTLGCQSPPTAVIVEVSADPDIAVDVFQIEAILSNAENSDVKTFPETKGDKLTFGTAFSITLSSDRTGPLDVALTGIASGGALVAHGEGSVALQPGHTVTLPITLHAGPSFCGDSVVDAGEQCDDGNRITDGTCDFRCQMRAGASCMVPLLTNGSFDQGNTGWAAVPADRPMIVLAEDAAATTGLPIQATTAPYIAWLGYDLVSTEMTLRQTFTIPADATSLVVGGYRQIRTDEGGCECDYGYVDVTVGTEVMAGVETWSAADAGTGWSYFTDTIPLVPGAAQTGAIQLRALMDDGVATNFFFDGVSVTAVRCP